MVNNLRFLLQNSQNSFAGIKSAEESLCGFSRFFKEFYLHRGRKIEQFYEDELARRQNSSDQPNPKMLLTDVKKKDTDRTAILNSVNIYFMKHDINDTLLSYTSYPWEIYFNHLQHLERKELKMGKSLMFFPQGFMMSHFDGIFGEDVDYYPDDVPGIIDHVVKIFTFKKDIR